jgi:hypothetical protein
MRVRGGSLRGRRRVPVRGDCHCSRCRAATGSAFKAFAGIERAKLRITEGEHGLLVFGEPEITDDLPRNEEY